MFPMKKTHFSLIAALWLLAACAPRAEAARELLPAEFQARAAQAGAQLVDVRQPQEHAESRLAGGRLIPLGELSERAAELDPARPVLLYCRTGRRSGKAVELLRAAGFKDVAHLTGGIRAWQGAGLPIER
jgi:rhodanese-related sulfurtransferase